MFLIPTVILIAGIVAGWWLRGIWERRPRILRWGKKKDANPSANGQSAEQGGSLVDRSARTGEKIVGKVVESIFGKPKGPKNDKEKP